MDGKAHVGRVDIMGKIWTYEMKTSNSSMLYMKNLGNKADISLKNISKSSRCCLQQ